MKRRILPMFMAVMMILSIIQMPAWAADESNPMETADSTELADVGGDDSNEGEPETQDGDDVAQIGDKGYPTLQAAITEATDGQTVKLLTTVTESVTVEAGKNITLNLNGQTLQDSAEARDSNASGRKHTIINKGTLTITGSGTVDNKSHACAALFNDAGANVTITGGAYTRSEESGSSSADNGGNSYYTLENYGTMTIGSQGADNDITVTANGHYSSLVHNGWQNSKDVNGKTATMTIYGGSFTGGINTIKNDEGGNLTICDGSFVNTTQYALQNWNIAVVEGGSFQSNTMAAVFNGSSEKTSVGQLTIEGGEFTSPANTSVLAVNNAATTSISGGTFSSDVSKYLAPSSNITTDSNGNWVVAPLTEENAVASVGGKYYNSLSAAIAEAKDGDTVTLLKDNETTDTIVVSENLTLDLHGCTLTLSQLQSEEPQFVVSSTGDLTIRDTLGNGKMDITGSLGVKLGKLTLESGTIESDYYGIYVYDNGTAVINGGTINSQYAGLSGNNTTGDMNFEVNGGELNATYGPAIYMPGQMTLKITGGILNGGISLRMGQVTISGGTINATTGSIDAPEDYYNQSVNAWLPDALYVFNGTYGSGNETYGNALNLTITGGTFNCANRQGSAIAIYDIGKVSQKSAVTISGNAELSTNAENREAYQVLSLKDIGVENPDTGYGNTEFVGKADTSISGGTFSSVVKEEYCADGFEPVTTPGSDGKYTVEVANDMTAKIVDANGNDVAAYETLDAALTHVTPGQTIVLLDNIQYSGKVSIPKGVTLDGNGKSITATSKITSGAFIEMTTGNVTIKDLVVNTDGKAKHGIQFYQTKGGKLSGVTVNGGSYTSVIVNGSRDISIKNCTLNPDSGAYANIEYAMGSDVTTVPSVTVSNVNYNSGKPLVYVDSNTIKRMENVDIDGTLTDAQIADALGQVNENVTISGMEMVWVNGSFVAKPIPTPVDPGDDDDNDNNNSGSTSVRRYNIEADAGRGGEISPDGRVRVRRGENQTFRITADDGWEIADVEVDGESVGAVERYTFENVRTDHTISATFRQIVTEPETPALPFTDVAEGDWYYDAVAYCWENGIMDGTSGTTFAPNLLLNRAMMAQVLYNLAGGTASTAAGFPDVAASAWYADAVNWAAANGYVTGYDNGSYGPEDSLTREQLAVILYRYAGSPAPAGTLDGFADAASASAYAVDALRWAVGEGLLTGKDGGRLDPTGTASRAELAQILARFAQM